MSFSHGSALRGGVAILSPRNFTGLVQEQLSDDEGRMIGINFKLEEEIFSVIGIYAPAIDVQEQKRAFFEKLRNYLVNFVSANVVLCGDFNVHLGQYDVEIGKYKSTSTSKCILELIEDFCLRDVWRWQNPTKREYTWRRLAPLQQSRIDYVFASETICCNFEVLSYIEAGVASDHSIVVISVASKHRQRGPGLYRFNNELLADNEFVELAKKEIRRAETNEDIYSGDISHGVMLEMLLGSLRVISIRRSKRIASEMKEEETRLLQQVTEFERDLTILSDSRKEMYERCRLKLDEIKAKRAKRAIIASGAKWVEEGEKATAYFLNRGKQLSAQKTINEINCNDHMIKDSKEILEYCAKYYERLFTPEGIDKSVMNQFLSCKEIPRLSREDRELCEGPISREECKDALANMNKNKAPGISGFTPEFFWFFWDDIGNIITSYINHAFNHGLFITQRRGVVTLIPKKGVKNELKNKRPICLLDVVYKLVAKVIANRIGQVADKIIAPEQTGFMKGRFVGENLRLLSDVIEYCEMDKKEGIIIACDYRAAFDSLDHEFMFAALKAYNFGETLIAWVRLLYQDASLSIMNNGYISRWFSCRRGTFQGSPLSGIIFDLAVEILAINIRNSVNIRGIKVSGIETKLSMYADDITLLVQDSQSGTEALRMVNEFSKASGLSLNLDKSHVMWIGSGKGKLEPIGDIKATEKIKVLGVWFSSTDSCISNNVEPICKKINDTINIWSQRSITIKGRITVTRSLLASYLVYLSSCVEIPKKSLNKIQSKIMKFVWRGRPPKVSKDVLVQDINQGGLRLVDVEAFYQSLKMTWIGRMYTNVDSAWRKIVQARLGKLELGDFIKSSLCKNDIMQLKIPMYYKNVFIQYQTYNYKPLDNVNNIRKEMLWCNRSIRIGGKTVYIDSLYQKGIKIIDDIVKKNGTLMSLDELKSKYPGVKINFLTYEALLRGIPQLWKQRLTSIPSKKVSEREKNDAPSIYVNNHEHSITNIRSKNFYDIGLNHKTPKAVIRWEELGYRNMNWEKIFSIPYECTKSTKLQSLQFRILHRYIPTRRYLYIRNVTNTPKCLHCSSEDTMEHFLLHCTSCKQIWIQIFRALSISSQNASKYILFGMPHKNNAVNLIILIVKQYLVSCKLSQEDRKPSYEGVRALISYHVSVEKYTAVVHNAVDVFFSKWQGVLDKLGIIA